MVRCRVALGLASAILLSCSNKEADPPPLAAKARAQWGAACKPLELTVETAPRARVRYLGQSYRADDKGTMFASVPADKLGERTTIEIVVEDERATVARTEVAVPPAPGALVSITAPRNLEAATANGEELERFDPHVEKPPKDMAYKAGGAKLDDTASFAVEITGCNLAPTKLPHPNAEITVERDRIIVTDKVGQTWATAAGPKSPSIELAAEIPASNGPPIALRIKTPVTYSKALAARFWRIAKEPMREAPDPKDVPAPRSIIVASYGTHLDRELLDDKTTPAMAPYVALVDRDFREHSPCFYGRSGTEAAASRLQSFTTVRIVAARTGRVVANRTFLGGMPKSCPAMVVTRGGVADVDLDGKAPDAAVIEAWIAKFRG